MHEHFDSPRKRLLQVFIVLFSFAMIELVVGFSINSLSLQADAWHMVLDTASVAIALVTAIQVERTTSRGDKERLEALAALIIAVLLIPTAYLLVAGGVRRSFHPQELSAQWMTITALAGLAVNLTCLRLLSSHASEHLHIRGARLHILADLLNSVAVSLAGAVIMLTEFYRLDGLIGLGIGLYLFIQAARLARRAITAIATSQQSVYHV